MHPPAPTGGAQGADAEIDELRAENASLRAEVSLLRRRDHSVEYEIRRIDEELRLAARLQRDFMPRTLPVVGDVKFRSVFRPAGYVSGDLYDVARLDEHHIGFYMADAVGHGMPAALLTMFMRHALVTKEILQGGGGYRLLPPSESLNRLNEMLVEQNLSAATFATAVCGVVDVRTGEVTISGAGHPPPVVLSPDGRQRLLEVDGPLLGIFGGEVFRDTTTVLSPGDRLVIYTDGVEVSFPGPGRKFAGIPGTTAGEPARGDLYDHERWLRELGALAHLGTEELIEAFLRCVDEQEGSLSPCDDLTLIFMDFGVAAATT